MFKKAKPIFFKAISSLHAGSGNDLGVIDLPIQRERHTGFPKIESSSLKGSIRESFENNKDIINGEIIDGEIKSFLEGKKQYLNFESLRQDYEYAIHLAFGYDEDGASVDISKKFGENTEFSGCLAFSDARILFFPVKSAKGIFAYITCPYILKRFNEDMSFIGENSKFEIDGVENGKCLVSDNSIVEINSHVILEEYTFQVTKFQDANILNLFKTFVPRLVILSDDDFKDFVNLSTEVITRTKIDNENGTVKEGALFNEEYLPPETVMYFMVFASPVFQKSDDMKGIFNKNEKSEYDNVMDFFDKAMPEYFQLGGNATLGKGLVQILKFEEN